MADTPLADLKPHPQNYNRHSDEQIKRLAESLERFGQPKEIVVWNGTIIAGHGLVEAARRLGWKTLRARDMSMDWSETEALAFMAADNELARLGDPDEAALAQLVASLGDIDAQLAALAAGTEERLKELLATLKAPPDDPGPQIDKAEELREKWGVEIGQLWQLGEHRLIVGDCTDAAVVERVMGGERIALLWADPPFGIEYTGHGASVDGRANKFAPITGDDRPRGEWLRFSVPINGGAIYLKSTWDVLHKWELILSGVADLKSRIVWDKCSHVAGDVLGGYATQSEIVLFAAIGRHKTNKFDSDVWRIPRATTGSPEQRTGHPYESPVELPSRAIENSSQHGDLVLDPFLGSGTTLIACERLGRRCRAIEISPAYVGVCLERWAVMTGGTPELIDG